MTKNREGIIIILSLITIATITFILCPPVSAVIPVTEGSITSSSIQWFWPAGSNITSLSVDGYLVNQYDHTSSTFVLSQLNPNETHTILINSLTDSGSDTAKTLPVTANQEAFYGNLNTWIYVLFIAVFMAIGTMRRLGIFHGIASLTSLYALVQYLMTTTPGADILTELPFIIYTLFIFFPLVCVYLKGGFLK
jgi:hypothetical protein